MKNTKLKTSVVEIPFEKPIQTAIHNIRSLGFVLLKLETDEGLVGESFLFTLNGLRLKVFNEMLKGFSHHVEGCDPNYVEAIWESIWNEISPTGHKGLNISALSAIDTACWDLLGKSANKPLHHIFGACRDKIKTYASGGLWLSYNTDELIREAQSFLDQGFKGMKIRVGHQNIHTDVERVRCIREAVGPGIELMVDANQSFTPKQAIKLGRLLEEFDLIWLEEPVAAHNLVGHSEVRSRLDIPIASGETEYTRYGMRSYIEAKACDILMPDLQRIGGLSEMRKTAALAAAFNMPFSTHIFLEHSLSIAGSAANCISVEHMPWNEPLFNEEILIKDGMIEIPQRPGCGFSFNEESIKRFKID